MAAALKRVINKSDTMRCVCEILPREIRQAMKPSSSKTNASSHPNLSDGEDGRDRLNGPISVS